MKAVHLFGRSFCDVTSLKLTGILLVLLLGSACRQDMHDQPRYEPNEGNAAYPDGRSDRPQVKGTLARGQLIVDELLHTGKEEGNFSTRFPFPVTKELLQRGRERYDIFCSVCHDRTGEGYGMAVQAGFIRPASFHDERLREAPPGYFFDVITNGFGAMYDYSDRITPRDRWAIVSFIRALQTSASVSEENLSESSRLQLSEE